MNLPGYDNWKTMSPDEDGPEECEFCGAVMGYSQRKGWQPAECTGECERSWRDPDAEYDAMRDGD